MRRSYWSARALLAAGFIGGVLSLYSITQGPPDAPPEELAVSLLILLSGAFLILGGLQLKDYKVQAERIGSIPAAILVGVGIATVVGGVLLFEPWRSDLTQGFRVFLAGGWALVGLSLSVLGERWRRNQASQYPLAVLSTGFLLSLFYVCFELFDPLLPPLPTPAMLLIIVVAGLPGAWLLSRSTPEEHQ